MYIYNQGSVDTLQTISLKNDYYFLHKRCWSNGTLISRSQFSTIWNIQQRLYLFTFFVCWEMPWFKTNKLHLDVSFRLRNNMKTKTCSSLIKEIQLKACNFHIYFTLFCTPYYLRHDFEFFSAYSLLLDVIDLFWKVKKSIKKTEYKMDESSSNEFVLLSLDKIRCIQQF